MLSKKSEAILDRLRRKIPGFEVGEIIDVEEFDPSDAISGLDKNIVLVTCYSAKHRIISTDLGDEFLIIQNNYLVSFFYDIALYALMCEPLKGETVSSDNQLLFHAIAKKFCSEHLETIKPSLFSRTLYIESVQHIEKDARPLYDALEENEFLSRKLNMFLKFVIWFIRYHEMGHASTIDERFHPFIYPIIDAYIESHETEIMDPYDREVLREETFSDIFSLCTCFAEFSPLLTESTLRNFSDFLIDSVSVLNFLYALSEDLHRLNVDSDFFGIDIREETLHWRHRREILKTFLNQFQFGDQTVVCRSTDKVGDIGLSEIILKPLQDDAAMTEPLASHTRRIAEQLAKGFLSESGFETVMEGFRTRTHLPVGI